MPYCFFLLNSLKKKSGRKDKERREEDRIREGGKELREDRGETREIHVRFEF